MSEWQKEEGKRGEGAGGGRAGKSPTEKVSSLWLQGQGDAPGDRKQPRAVPRLVFLLLFTFFSFSDCVWLQFVFGNIHEHPRSIQRLPRINLEAAGVSRDHFALNDFPGNHQILEIDFPSVSSDIFDENLRNWCRTIFQPSIYIKNYRSTAPPAPRDYSRVPMGSRDPNRHRTPWFPGAMDHWVSLPCCSESVVLNYMFLWPCLCALLGQTCSNLFLLLGRTRVS